MTASTRCCDSLKERGGRCDRRRRDGTANGRPMLATSTPTGRLPERELDTRPLKFLSVGCNGGMKRSLGGDQQPRRRGKVDTGKKLPSVEDLRGAKGRLLGLVRQLYNTDEVQFGATEQGGVDAWVRLPCGRELRAEGYAPKLLAKISWKNRTRLVAHETFLTLCKEQMEASSTAAASLKPGEVGDVNRQVLRSRGVAAILIRALLGARSGCRT